MKNQMKDSMTNRRKIKRKPSASSFLFLKGEIKNEKGVLCGESN